MSSSDIITRSERFAREQLPSNLQMAKNLLQSAIDVAKDGASQRNKEEQDAVLKICSECEFFIKDSARCSKCGCYMNIKARLASLHCPIGKW